MSFFKRKDFFTGVPVSTALYEGLRLDCVPGELAGAQQLFGREVLDNIQLSVRFWAADLRNTPEVGKRVTVDGTVYRILEVRRRLDFIVLALGAEFQK